MNIFVFIVLGLALLVVLATLFMGLFMMTKDGEDARRKSNKMMRWRVILQGVAVLLLLLVALAAN